MLVVLGLQMARRNLKKRKKKEGMAYLHKRKEEEDSWGKGQILGSAAKCVGGKEKREPFASPEKGERGDRTYKKRGKGTTDCRREGEVPDPRNQLISRRLKKGEKIFLQESVGEGEGGGQFLPGSFKRKIGRRLKGGGRVVFV